MFERPSEGLRRAVTHDRNPLDEWRSHNRTPLHAKKYEKYVKYKKYKKYKKYNKYKKYCVPDVQEHKDTHVNRINQNLNPACPPRRYCFLDYHSLLKIKLGRSS